MRRLFIRYIYGSYICDCALHRLIHKPFVTTAHRTGERRGLWFSGYRSLLWHVTDSAFARLQMTGVHNFFRLYALVIWDHAPAQRKVEGFDFVFAVRHSNHHTLGTASWQNHDSSFPQSVIILHCRVCLCLSNPYFSSALWRQCKVQTQHIYQAIDIPVLFRVWVKQWLQMTGALFIAYDALRINI